MIEGLLTALPAIVLGCIIVRLLMPADPWKPTWIRWVFEISLGAGIGVGLTSCLYFVLLWAGTASRSAIAICESVALVTGIGLLYFRRGINPARAHGEPAPALQFSWNWALRLAAVLSLTLFLMDFGQGFATSPHGEWDAFSVWNVRAKFLAGGPETWRVAVSNQMSGQMIGASHPSYPLMLSGSVTRQWILAKDTDPADPAALSLLFTLAALGTLFGAVTWFSGSETLGLLAMLILLGTEAFVSQVASQYADIPLSFFILGAVALLGCAYSRNWPSGLLVLAGLCAGLAPWTKNEGIPFVFFVVVAAAWGGGLRAALWTALGAAPGALVTAAFKLFLSPGGEAILPTTAAEAFSKIIDPWRWVRVIISFGTNIWELGVPWAHPVLLLGVLAFVLGFSARAQWRSRRWLLLPVAGLLAIDFGVYLVTTADLAWHLDTSNSRLLLQVWPAVLFLFFLGLQPPVSAQPEVVAAGAGKRAVEPERRKRKR